MNATTGSTTRNKSRSSSSNSSRSSSTTMTTIVKLLTCICVSLMIFISFIFVFYETTTTTTASASTSTSTSTTAPSLSSLLLGVLLGTPTTTTAKTRPRPATATTTATTTKTTTKTTTTTTTRISIDNVRNEFYIRYGGKSLAQQIYQRGIQSFGTDSRLHTAQRFLSILAATPTPTPSSSSSSSSSSLQQQQQQQQQQQKQFVLSFAGYSVTVGRGNHYNQSYPFVVQRIIQPLLKTIFVIDDEENDIFDERNSNSKNSIDFIVRNSAIGGIPSFPYGFCLSHFLGNDANGISWDYSMNEGKSSTVLEAYIRQSQNQLSSTQPMMIVLDTNIERCQLIQQYIETHLLRDGLCVGMANDAVPNLNDIVAGGTNHQNTNDATIPIGFQHWNEFGAGPSCPGRGNWHPKKMEHELIGYMIAMYFVDAIEIAKQIISDHPNDWKTLYATTTPFQPKHNNNNDDVVHFPPPMTLASLPEKNDPAVTNLLYGHRDPNTESLQQYTMNHVSCRTNFLPAIDIENVLSSIVVDGLNSVTTSENIMTPRTDRMYEDGWVLDVSNVERDTKVKVEQCGGLGYVDMKISLYGIPKSGTVRLWLPIESSTGHGKMMDTKMATNYYHELIICEANEKRNKDACRLDTDMEYIVGGSTKVTPSMIHGAGEYLKRPTCVHIGIPNDAVITTLQDVRPLHPNSDLVTIQRRLAGGSDQHQHQQQRRNNNNNNNNKNPYDMDQIGLIVDVRAKNENVSRDKGTCCISHVVWEEKRFVVE